MALFIRMRQCILLVLAFAHIAYPHVIHQHGLNETNFGINARDQLVHKRRIPDNQNPNPFSNHELDMINTVCYSIERWVQPYDYWFFVGNSGGYVHASNTNLAIPNPSIGISHIALTTHE